MYYQFYIGVLSFLLYYIFIHNKRAKKLVKSKFSEEKESFYWVLCTRLIAFILMCLVPLSFSKITNSHSWELIYSWSELDTLAITVLAALLIPLGALNAKGEKHLKQYPQVRMASWSKGEYILNILSWGLYLLAYEYLFRGVLFLGILAYTKLSYAIIINTLLYALAHVHKEKKEIIGSIPFGILVCYITYHTNTIWTAFFAHWIMATNNFVWSQYYTRKN